MRDKLLRTINKTNFRIMELREKLSNEGFTFNDDFTYSDVNKSATEEELIQYLLDISYANKERDRAIGSIVRGLEIYEIFRDCSPEDILQEAYNRKYVYEAVENLELGIRTKQEFLEYLHSTHDEN